MLTLNRIKGTNATEVTMGNKTVLYSYSTPVAFHFTNGKQTIGDRAVEWVKTSKKWSVTTSRQLNKWIRENGAYDILEVSQDELEALLS